MEVVFSGLFLFLFLHWAAKEAQPEPSVHANKDGGVLVGYIVKPLYTFNCLTNNPRNAAGLEVREATSKHAVNSQGHHRDLCRLLTSPSLQTGRSEVGFLRQSKYSRQSLSGRKKALCF